MDWYKNHQIDSMIIIRLVWIDIMIRKEVIKNKY
jgi:hypothetical protein